MGRPGCISRERSHYDNPSYLTPEIKSLLRKKNRLMSSGRTEETSACAAGIGKAIEKTTKKHLRGIASRTTPTKLWDNVKSIQGQKKDSSNLENLKAEDFNTHYAAIS